MADLLELAARCEAADGLLAEEVARYVLGEALKIIYPSPVPFRVPKMADGRDWPGDGIGPYTDEAKRWMARNKQFSRLVQAGAFLDAAMMLVPEGAAWRLYHWPKQTEGARACCLVEGGRETWGATPTLALLAVVLKVRSQ